jgi:hypothetical protein
MGTSSPYSSPSSADWSVLKGNLTRLTKNPSNSNLQSKVISQFIEAIGGTSGFSSSNKIGEKGGSFSSASARKTAQNIADFFSSVQSNGLQQTLDDTNLSNLKNKNIDDIKEELVDYFSEPAINGDSISARKAAEKTLDEMLENIETIEDMEKSLNSIELENFLCTFFANYLNALFYRTFEEEYNNKNNVNPHDAARILKHIEQDITERVKSCQIDKDLSKIDWKNQEGQNIIQEILKDSLELLKG